MNRKRYQDGMTPKLTPADKLASRLKTRPLSLTRRNFPKRIGYGHDGSKG